MSNDSFAGLFFGNKLLKRALLFPNHMETSIHILALTCAIIGLFSG